MSSVPDRTTESAISNIETRSTTAKYSDEEDSPGAFSILIGTSSNSTHEEINGSISILIRDDDDRTTDRTLLRYSHTHPIPFTSGHTDLFVISNQPSLSNLKNVELTYKSRDGSEKEWKMLNLYVFHHESGKIYKFEVDEQASDPNNTLLIPKEAPVKLMPDRLDNPFE